MKIIIFFNFLLILILSSCSDLKLDNISCDGDSNKCPTDAICYNNTCRQCPESSIKSGDTCTCNDSYNYEYQYEKNYCLKLKKCSDYNDCDNNSICYSTSCRECPENSTKSGDTCICNNTEENYYYTNKNTCEPLACSPKNENYVTRTLSCQDGLGYCIRTSSNTAECKPNYCSNDLDCGEKEQCSFIMEKNEPNLFILTCQRIGESDLDQHCNNSTLFCKNGLSCLPSDDSSFNKCKKLCIPNNDKEVASCDENEMCVDFAYFANDTQPDMIGICLESSCEFNDTDDIGYTAEVNNSCNNKNGVCYRENTDMNIGYCAKDECSPVMNSCPNNETCVFNGSIYECKKNIEGGVDKGASCNNENLICKIDLTCVKSGEGKECQKLCRPENTYNYNNCGSGENCIDIKEIYDDNPPAEIKQVNSGVIGFCITKE